MTDLSLYQLHFAPLQGYTDRIFRNAFDRCFGGVDAYYTPFIRVEKGTFRNRDLRDIDPQSEQVEHLVPQILPGSAEECRMLIDLIQSEGYKTIDINLGCPFPLIAGKRKGAGMLPYPELVEEVLSPLEAYPEIDFSLKMRLGWENVSECMDLVTILNCLRLTHITIHARIGKQQYKGKTNPEAFRQFYESSRHPLFYNGDLCTIEEIKKILLDFPALRGVAVGRGLLSSPLMAKEFQKNETFSEKECMALYFSFHEEMFYAYYERLEGDSHLLMKMKTLWDYFLPETDRKCLKKIKKATTVSLYRQIVKEIFCL